MATTEFIAAIELGSSKITGVAGRKNSDGSMQVLAYAQEDSSADESVSADDVQNNGGYIVQSFGYQD